MDERIQQIAVGFFVQLSVTLLLRTFGGTGLLFASLIALPLTAIVLLWPYAPAIVSGVAARVDGVEVVAETDTGEGDGISGELLDVIRLFGIEGGSRRLKDSKYEPIAVLDGTHESLLYMGISAPKWIESRAARRSFRSMLKRVGGQEKRVRFLLLDPAWEQYDRYISIEKTVEETTSHFDYFLELMAENDNFEARLYDGQPPFRLIFKDSDFVAFSRYRFDGTFGWQHPHVEVTKEAPYSLHRPLREVFRFYWEHAEPMNGDAS